MIAYTITIRDRVLGAILFALVTVWHVVFLLCRRQGERSSLLLEGSF